MTALFTQILIRHGFEKDTALTCAAVFTQNSIDGVYSHGINRFPRFIAHIKSGIVLPRSQAILKSKAGNIEQWEGQSGPGLVNALLCTARAMEIATQGGIGCVALSRTNHWMRGGTYGWRAAREGFVFVGWSNTIANTPAWGAVNCKLGNNPLVIAVPYKSDAIVLDMAMSQYSYGAMEMYQLRDEPLPVPGGYDSNGNLSVDPVAIRKSERTLPIGYWKGSGLSLLLDILATILSGGLSVSEISKQKSEHNLSQVFIAIHLARLQNFASIATAIDQIIVDFHQSRPEKEERQIRFPGQQTVANRDENTRLGIPVALRVWEEVQSL